MGKDIGREKRREAPMEGVKPSGTLTLENRRLTEKRKIKRTSFGSRYKTAEKG